MQTLKQFFDSNEINISPEQLTYGDTPLIFNERGELDRSGKIWVYARKSLGLGGNEFTLVIVNDYKREPSRFVYRSSECEDSTAALNQMFTKETVCTGELQRNVAKRLAADWENNAEGLCSEYPGEQGSTFKYLVKKKIAATPGVKWNKYHHSTALVVPLYDGHGRLWTWQLISEEGVKRYAPAGRTKGVFHPIGGMGTLVDAKAIYACEGYATGVSLASVYGNSGESIAVVCAMSAGNLTPVVTELRIKYPGAQIVVCADNDRHKEVNVGLRSAVKAVKAAGERGTLIVPYYNVSEEASAAKGTDFNDAVNDGSVGFAYTVQAINLDTVKILEKGKPTKPKAEKIAAPIQAAESSETPTPQPAHREEPSPPQEHNEPSAAALKQTTPAHSEADTTPTIEAPTITPQPPEGVSGTGRGAGKVKKPAPAVTAALLARHHEGRFIRYKDDLFMYTGTHWQFMGKTETLDFKAAVTTFLNDDATPQQVDAIFYFFKMKTPKVPESVDMFCPRPNVTNFLNGTVHIIKQEIGGKLTFTFNRGHNPEDYLTHVIPHDWPEDATIRNTMLDSMVEKVFSGDGDRQEKIRAVKQMYGAMLFPVFPHIFMLHGPSGCGKSSLLFPITDCLHKNNISHVEPHEFSKSFILASMAGKLVNVVTDIAKNIPIDDANLKKVEDMTPVRMDRKYLEAVDATLPFVHVFGANSIPPSREASGAHGRRWTFISMGAWRLDEKSIYDREYGHAVFKHCPAGVLNFAREGIMDLIERNGIYTIFDSSRETIEEMRVNSDPVLAFLDELGTGKLATSCGKTAEKRDSAVCSRNDLWRVFNAWQMEYFTQKEYLSSRSFFKRMAEHSRDSSVTLTRSRKEREYSGINVTGCEIYGDAVNGQPF
jgi:phage/plasmid primase-like uncharacterized protein/phage/plasmid-associated DNA primase